VVSNKAAKVLVWRAISMLVALFVTWLYIGEVKSSLELTIVLTVIMTVLHYIFEIAWDRRVGT
jgi:uncharacterized membrane protein